jgi:hypothetical protein
MSWRLLCPPCFRASRIEEKSIGIMVNPDLVCAACGTKIRSRNDEDGQGKRWFAVLQRCLDEWLRARGQ